MKRKDLAKRRPKPRTRRPADAPPAGACGVTLARAPGIGLVLGTTVGRWSRQNPVVLRVPDEEVVGAVESGQDFGALCAKVGILVLAAITNTPVAEGPDAVVKGLIRWSGIDVEALRRELLSEAEALGGTPGPDGPAVTGDPEAPAVPAPEGTLRMTEDRARA